MPIYPNNIQFQPLIKRLRIVEGNFIIHSNKNTPSTARLLPNAVVDNFPRYLFAVVVARL